MSIISDCTSSKITYERLINVVDKVNTQLKNTFNIVILNLYNPDDAIVADKLNVFDAPCITCNNKHLSGLVQEDVIYNFLKQFVEND